MSTPSVVVSTTVVSSAGPTPTQCAASLYEMPVRDIACAVRYSEDNIKHMADCCNDADVIAYYNNCGLYCLAQGQSAKDLTDCLYEKKVPYQDVFCNGNQTASATGSGTAGLVPSASASVVAGNDDDNDDDNNNNNGSGSNNNGDSNNNDNGDGGSAASKPGVGVMGVTVGALLFSALFGAFQL